MLVQCLHSTNGVRLVKILSSVQAIHVFFVQSESVDLAVVAVYVDDLITVTKSPEIMKQLRAISQDISRWRILGNPLMLEDYHIVYDKQKSYLWMH